MTRYARLRVARRLDNLPKDSLSGLLRGLEVHSTVYCVSDLSAPWGFHVEDSSAAKFHLVLEGDCLLSLDTGEQLALESGDVVLMPQGTGHTVRDRLDSSVRELGRILAEYRVDDEAPLVYGGRGAPARLLCGGFVLSDSLPAGLLALLPRALRLDSGASGMHRWLEPVFSLLHEELGGARPGASAILAKLADVFLAEVLRTYLIGAQETGVLSLAAFDDPAIARSVSLMHSSPAEPWTVSRLAGEVGMSRTLFSTRFRECLGDSPMHYLAHVRLSRAAGQLTTTTATLFAIAQQLGYDSEASFSKAFKRAFSRSPGEYRREGLTQPIRIAESI